MFIKDYFLSLLCIFIFSQEKVFAQSNPEAIRIIKAAEDQMRGASSEATITMTIVRPDYTRKVSMKSWSLGEKYGLTIITSPVKDKGMAFLKRDKEIWNWQPSIDRTIKMPPSMMSQGWMGSDLTTEDLVRQNSIILDYNHTLLPGQNLQGIPCYVVELIPKANAAVVWGKIKMYISEKDYLQYKAEFFDEDMQLVNTINGSEPVTVGKRKLLSVMEIIPKNKPKQKTIFSYDKIVFDISLKESFFSLQNVKKIKV
jgi:hypothetical protein